MKVFRLFTFLLILICLPCTFFAQIPRRGNPTNPETASQAGMKAAEQILSEVGSLKFPQDRAYILSNVGEFLCRNGEKDRAGKIFEESLRELISAQTKAKKTDGNIYEHLIYGYHPRGLIIQAISNCDAEAAYNFLLQSRPLKLAQILDDFYKNRIYPEEKSVAGNAVNIEMFRESLLKLQISRNRPARLAEFIGQDIEKAITYRTIELIKELNRKDSALAGQLTEKAVNKILQLKFYDYEKKKPLRTGYDNNLLIAMSFLRELENEPPTGAIPKLIISEETLKRLADTISQETINSGVYLFFSDSMKTIKRFFPERIAQLEKVKTDISNSPDNLEKRKYRQMFKENLPDEAIVASAENFSESNQKDVFRLIACRQASEGKFDQAKSFITEKFGEKGMGRILLSYVFYSNALQFFSEDFEKASASAGQIPDILINLDAQTSLLAGFYNKNPEQNKSEALILLSELTKQFDSTFAPENRESGLGKILRAYSLINAEQAFPLLEFLIYQTNKTDDSDSFFGSVEKLPTGGIRQKSGIKFGYAITVKHLAKSDIDRTLLVINKLNRPVSRIKLKLAVINTEQSDYRFQDILFFCSLSRRSNLIRF